MEDKTMKNIQIQIEEGTPLTLMALAQAVEEQTNEEVMTGNVADFETFRSYFEHHYKPLLQKIINEGVDALDGAEVHVLDYLAEDICSTFCAELQPSGWQTLVLFDNDEEYRKAKAWFAADGDGVLNFSASCDSARSLSFGYHDECKLVEGALKLDLRGIGIGQYNMESRPNINF